MSKSKEEAAVKHVFKYLSDQNRPYSVIDIFNNLHKEHGKTVVTRALEQLASENKIKEKTYGKQKVYFVNQDIFPEVNDDDIKNMDTEISCLNEELRELKQGIKAKENVMENLGNSMTTEEAANYLARIQKEIPLMQSKLKLLESNASIVKPEVQRSLMAKKEKLHKEWQKRKRIACDMLDAVLENYPKNKTELCEEIGVETDEGYFIPK